MPPTNVSTSQGWQNSGPNMQNAPPNNNGAPASNGKYLTNVFGQTLLVTSFKNMLRFRYK